MKDKFPASQLYDEMIYFQYKNQEETINFEISDYTTIDATSEKGLSYNKNLLKILENINSDITKEEIPCLVIERFISNKFDSAGFDDREMEIPVKMDYVYSNLKKLIKNPNKDILLVSFGEKFRTPKSMEQTKISEALPFRCEKTFDARHINSSKPKGGGLRDLRGTDEIIQKCIESGSGFEFVMTCIVKYIEENNSKIIGVYCTAGHHRSCAVIELLKKHLYPNAKIKHLHINR